MKRTLSILTEPRWLDAARPWRIVLCAALMLLISALTASAQAQTLAVDHITRQLTDAKLIGRMSASKTLTPEIVLPLRDKAGLEDLLQRLYDPHDPLFGHYLKPGEFADRFGPSVADVNAVAAWANSKGLSVAEVSANRTAIKVTGPVRTVEAAFGVQVNEFIAADGRRVFAPDRAIALDPAVSGKVLDVVGLDNVAKGESFLHQAKPASMNAAAALDAAIAGTPLVNSAHGALLPGDTHTIYNIPSGTGYDGTGQTLGLFELDGYTASDITTLNTKLGQFGQTVPTATVTPESVDGFSTKPTDNNIIPEVTLDIDMMLAIAPKASNVIVYEGPGDTEAFQTLVLDIFNKMASDDTCNIISVSYGLSEDAFSTPNLQADEAAAMQLASQGQEVCVAAGDAGAYTDETISTPNVSNPASLPYVTAVGGTDLTDSSSAPYTYVSETSWSDTGDKGRGSIGTGGGGGFSSLWTIPNWQAPVVNSSEPTYSSASFRNLPDVSLYGDYDDGGYYIYLTNIKTKKGGYYGYNGTSASAPLWASFLAVVNQQRGLAGRPALGFADPALYTLGANPTAYARDFHDIADGSTNLYYVAIPGYDDSTGLGTIIGSPLVQDVTYYDVPPTVATQASANPNPVTGTSTALSVLGAFAGGESNLTYTWSVTSGPSGVTLSANGTNAAKNTTATFTQIGSYTFQVTIETPGGLTTTSTVMVSVTQGPTVVTVSPTTVSVSAGSTQTFTASVTDQFGAAIASPSIAWSVSGGGTITTGGVFTAGSTAGTYTVTATATADGASQTGTASVTVVSSGPSITSFTPTSGPTGTMVTIAGTSFTGATFVTFNGTVASFTVNSDTQITAIVPSGATTGVIKVRTGSGVTASSGTFTVTAGSILPSITSFTPTSGPVGTIVTITGANFTGATFVTFNGTSASFTVNSSTQITANVPSGATTGAIKVRTSNGVAASATSFTVTAGSVLPTITSFSPTSGPVGTSVVITGTNFTGATFVTFGGTVASFTVNSDTQITATVPSGAATGVIKVRTPNGVTASATSFTVTP